MGASVDYLHRDKKTGRLSFRRVYPASLRRHIPGAPKQLKRSLKASRLDAPDAMDIYRAALAEYEAQVSAARKLSTRSFDALDAPQIAYLAALFEHQAAAGDEQAIEAGDTDQIERTKAGWLWMRDEYQQWRIENDTDAIVSHWSETASRLLGAEGIVLDPADSDGLTRLCRALNDTALKMRDAQMERLSGAIVPVPPAPENPAFLSSPRPQPRAGANTEYTFGEVAERVLINIASPVSGSTSHHQQYEMFFTGASFVTKGRTFRCYDWDSAGALVNGILDGYDLADELTPR